MKSQGSHTAGQSLTDPYRADRRLRRFSWQPPVPDQTPPPPRLCVGPLKATP